MKEASEGNKGGQRLRTLLCGRRWRRRTPLRVPSLFFAPPGEPPASPSSTWIAHTRQVLLPRSIVLGRSNAKDVAPGEPCDRIMIANPRFSPSTRINPAISHQAKPYSANATRKRYFDIACQRFLSLNEFVIFGRIGDINRIRWTR